MLIDGVALRTASLNEELRGPNRFTEPKSGRALSSQESVGDCDSGVDNQYLGDGTFMNDLIDELEEDAYKHGPFVKAVSRLANGWQKDGIISGRENGKITSCAARSDVGK